MLHQSSLCCATGGERERWGRRRGQAGPLPRGRGRRGKAEQRARTTGAGRGGRPRETEAERRGRRSRAESCASAGEATKATIGWGPGHEPL